MVHMHRRIAYFPPVNTFPSAHFPEHAYISLPDLLKSLVYTMYTTSALQKEFHWFYDPVSQNILLNHLKIGVFFMDFLCGGRLHLLCVHVVNLISLLQMAKFTWVAQFIFAPEDDPCTWMLLVMFDEEVMRLLLEEGFAVQFVDSLLDNVTVPHTSDKLAGTTVHMTVDFTFTPDGKALLLSNGSKSINSTIPSPYSRLSKDTLMHLDYACAKYHTFYEERMADYQALKF